LFLLAVCVQDKAFGNNYRRPIIGYEQDIADLSRQDISAFFDAHYGPESLSIAVVGDITTREVERLANKYFGDWQVSRPRMQLASNGAGRAGFATGTSEDAGAQLLTDALSARTAQPTNLAENCQVVLPSQAGPAAYMCYYRPAAQPTGVTVALSILSEVISGSRVSRAYRQLVATGALHSQFCFRLYLTVQLYAYVYKVD
jgi:Peptidase M16 inactive domain